jgi:hypothetical protein
LHLYKLPIFKRRFEKLKIDHPIEVYNKVFTDKTYGVSIWVSGGILAGFIAILLVSLEFILISLLDLDIDVGLNHFIVFGLILYAICQIFVFRKDKYLKHFKKYEAWTRNEKRNYLLLSIGFLLGVIILFFVSLLLF